MGGALLAAGGPGRARMAPAVALSHPQPEGREQEPLTTRIGPCFTVPRPPARGWGAHFNMAVYQKEVTNTVSRAELLKSARVRAISVPLRFAAVSHAEPARFRGAL